MYIYIYIYIYMLYTDKQQEVRRHALLPEPRDLPREALPLELRHLVGSIIHMIIITCIITSITTIITLLSLLLLL